MVLYSVLFSYTFLIESSIAGYCGEKVQQPVLIEDWTAAVRVIETLKDGHEQKSCDYLQSGCPEDNMPNCSAVTTIVCNYAANSITMLVTVNATSNGTVLSVTSSNFTQPYKINLEGMFVAIGKSQCLRSFFSDSNYSTSVKVDHIDQDVQVDIEPFTCLGWENYSILYSLVLEGNEIRNYSNSNLNATFTDVVPNSYIVEVIITNSCGQRILLRESITVPGICHFKLSIIIPNT